MRVTRRLHPPPTGLGVPNAHQRGNKIISGYMTLPFVGPTCGPSGYAPVTVSGVSSSQRGDKIRSGYLSPDISGALMISDFDPELRVGNP